MAYDFTDDLAYFPAHFKEAQSSGRSQGCVERTRPNLVKACFRFYIGLHCTISKRTQPKGERGRKLTQIHRSTGTSCKLVTDLLTEILVCRRELGKAFPVSTCLSYMGARRHGQEGALAPLEML